MRRTSSHLLLGLLLLLGLGWAMPGHADVTVAMRQFSAPGVRLQTVAARLSAAPDGGVLVQLQAAQAEVAALGWQRVGVRLDGRLYRDARARWVFDGRARLADAPGGALTDAQVNGLVSASADTVQVTLQQGKASGSAWLPLDQPSHAQISLRHWPVAWLQGLVAKVWGGRLGAGQVTADLAIDVRDKRVQSSGQFALDGVGFDTPNGKLAAGTLNGDGRFSFEQNPDGSRLTVQGGLNGGELLVGDMYAKLPFHPLQLDVAARIRRGALDVERLRVNDADALQLDGSFATDAKGNLQRLRISRLHASFPAAYERYGRTWLATLGVRNAHITGHLSGQLDWAADGLRAFAFNTDGLDVVDAGGKFGVTGLRGGLDWAAKGERPATRLAWHSLRAYRLEAGAAQSQWQTYTGSLELTSPFVIPLYKGQLRVARIDYRPTASETQRLATSLAVTGVDMASLSHALGWPVFSGTLGGAIPSLRWQGDRLDLAGGLSINVFGGFIDMTAVSLQQPFGDSPVLAANVQLSQLDLGALTGVFDFGSITGRLDGNIDDLRLVGWSPVAFKASLLAAGGGRISQRAVNNLTVVGGGGVAAGLQGAVLKLFKTFSYKRIGLNCTLHGAVCDMSGLKDEDGGYTIVEGSGLPRLEVIGYQTRVDWPTLVHRLRDAVKGNAPVVR